MVFHGFASMLGRLSIGGRIGLLGSLVLFAGCGAGSPPSTTAQSANPISSPQPNASAGQPLTFYLGKDMIEPFTPYYVQPLNSGRFLAVGIVPSQGADYAAQYDPANWLPLSSSNGFVPGDPEWACDQTPEHAIVAAPDGAFLTRACPDGSFTVFSLPNGTTVLHQGSAPDAIAVGARIPSAVFAPNGTLLALTDDGPAGPGQNIALIDTRTWKTKRQIMVPNGLLTQPTWSPDGTRIAAVDLLGTLFVWDAQSGKQLAFSPIQEFALGEGAADPAAPGPSWSPDGAALITTTPLVGGSRLTRWAFAVGALKEGASAHIAPAPYIAAPQLSPDGSMLFVHTLGGGGQVYPAKTLAAGNAFALPGTLVAWGTDAQHLLVFTLQSTVVTLTVG